LLGFNIGEKCNSFSIVQIQKLTRKEKALKERAFHQASTALETIAYANEEVHTSSAERSGNISAG